MEQRATISGSNRETQIASACSRMHSLIDDVGQLLKQLEERYNAALNPGRNPDKETGVNPAPMPVKAPLAGALDNASDKLVVIRAQIRSIIDRCEL